MSFYEPIYGNNYANDEERRELLASPFEGDKGDENDNRLILSTPVKTQSHEFVSPGTNASPSPIQQRRVENVNNNTNVRNSVSTSGDTKAAMISASPPPFPKSEPPRPPISPPHSSAVHRHSGYGSGPSGTGSSPTGRRRRRFIPGRAKMTDGGAEVSASPSYGRPSVDGGYGSPFRSLDVGGSGNMLMSSYGSGARRPTDGTALSISATNPDSIVFDEPHEGDSRPGSNRYRLDSLAGHRTAIIQYQQLSPSMEVVGERIGTSNGVSMRPESQGSTSILIGSRNGIPQPPKEPSQRLGDSSRPDLLRATAAVLQPRPPSAKSASSKRPAIIPSSPQTFRSATRPEDNITSSKRKPKVRRKVIGADNNGEGGGVLLRRTFMGVTKVLYEDGRVAEIKWDDIDPKVAGMINPRKDNGDNDAESKEMNLTGASKTTDSGSGKEIPTSEAISKIFGNYSWEKSVMNHGKTDVNNQGLAAPSESSSRQSSLDRENGEEVKNAITSGEKEHSPERRASATALSFVPLMQKHLGAAGGAASSKYILSPRSSSPKDSHSSTAPSSPMSPSTPKGIFTGSISPHAKTAPEHSPVFYSPVADVPGGILKCSDGESSPLHRRQSVGTSPTTGKVPALDASCDLDGLSSQGYVLTTQRRKSTTFILDKLISEPVEESIKIPPNAAEISSSNFAKVIRPNRQGDESVVIESSDMVKSSCGESSTFMTEYASAPNIMESWEDELDALRHPTMEGAHSLFTIPLPQLSADGEMDLDDIQLCGISIHELFRRLFDREKGAMRSQLSGLDVNRFMRHSLSANEMVAMFFWFVVVHCRRVYMERLLIGRVQRLITLYQELFPRGNNKEAIPGIARLRQLVVELDHASRRWTRKTRRGGGGVSNSSVVREDDMSPHLTQELNAMLQKGNYSTILSMPEVYRGGTLPSLEVVASVSNALNLLSCAVLEREELVRYEELCFHRLAILFGNIFTEVGSEEKDVILQSYGFIVVRLTNYSLHYTFPNDANAGLFHADFRADMYRIFQFWCSGLQVTHVAVKGWPVPIMADFDLEKEREENRLRELMEAYENGYQRGVGLHNEELATYRFGVEKSADDELTADDAADTLSNQGGHHNQTMPSFTDRRNSHGSITSERAGSSIVEFENNFAAPIERSYSSIGSGTVVSAGGLGHSKHAKDSKLAPNIRKGSVSQMLGVDDIREEMHSSFGTLPEVVGRRGSVARKRSISKVTSNRPSDSTRTVGEFKKKRKSSTKCVEKEEDDEVVIPEAHSIRHTEAGNEDEKENDDDDEDEDMPRPDTQGSTGSTGGNEFHASRSFGKSSRVSASRWDGRKTTLEKKASGFAHENAIRAQALGDDAYEDIDVQCANAEYRLLHYYHRYSRHAQNLQQEGEKRVQRTYKRLKREAQVRHRKLQLSQRNAAKSGTFSFSTGHNVNSKHNPNPTEYVEGTLSLAEAPSNPVATSPVATGVDVLPPLNIMDGNKKSSLGFGFHANQAPKKGPGRGLRNPLQSSTAGFAPSLTVSTLPNITALSGNDTNSNSNSNDTPDNDSGGGGGAEPTRLDTGFDTAPSTVPKTAPGPIHQLPFIHILTDEEDPLGHGGANQKSFFSTFTTANSVGADIPSFFFGDDNLEASGSLGAVPVLQTTGSRFASNSLSMATTTPIPLGSTANRTGGVSRQSPSKSSSGGNQVNMTVNPPAPIRSPTTMTVTPIIGNADAHGGAFGPHSHSNFNTTTSTSSTLSHVLPLSAGGLCTFGKEQNANQANAAQFNPKSPQNGASITRLFMNRLNKKLASRKIEKVRKYFKTEPIPKAPAHSLLAIAKQAKERCRQQQPDAGAQNAEPLPVSKLLQGGSNDASLISSQPLNSLRDEECKFYFRHVNPVRPVRVPFPEASANSVHGHAQKGLQEETVDGEVPSTNGGSQRRGSVLDSVDDASENKRLYKRQLLPSSSPFMTYYSATVLNLEVMQASTKGNNGAGQNSFHLNAGVPTSTAELASFLFRDTTAVGSPFLGGTFSPLYQSHHPLEMNNGIPVNSGLFNGTDSSAQPSSTGFSRRVSISSGAAPKHKFKGVGRAVVNKTHLLVVPREDGLHRPVLYKPLCRSAYHQLNNIMSDFKKISKREYNSRQQYIGDHLSVISEIHRIEAPMAEVKFMQRARANLELDIKRRTRDLTESSPTVPNTVPSAQKDTPASHGEGGFPLPKPSLAHGSTTEKVYEPSFVSIIHQSLITDDEVDVESCSNNVLPSNGRPSVSVRIRSKEELQNSDYTETLRLASPPDTESTTVGASDDFSSLSQRYHDLRSEFSLMQLEMGKSAQRHADVAEEYERQLQQAEETIRNLRISQNSLETVVQGMEEEHRIELKSLEKKKDEELRRAKQFYERAEGNWESERRGWQLRLESAVSEQVKSESMVLAWMAKYEALEGVLNDLQLEMNRDESIFALEGRLGSQAVPLLNDVRSFNYSGISADQSSSQQTLRQLNKNEDSVSANQGNTIKIPKFSNPELQLSIDITNDDQNSDNTSLCRNACNGSTNRPSDSRPTTDMPVTENASSESPVTTTTSTQTIETHAVKCQDNILQNDTLGSADAQDSHVFESRELAVDVQLMNLKEELQCQKLCIAEKEEELDQSKALYELSVKELHALRQAQLEVHQQNDDLRSRLKHTQEGIKDFYGWINEKVCSLIKKKNVVLSKQISPRCFTSLSEDSLSLVSATNSASTRKAHITLSGESQHFNRRPLSGTIEGGKRRNTVSSTCSSISYRSNTVDPLARTPRGMPKRSVIHQLLDERLPLSTQNEAMMTAPVDNTISSCVEVPIECESSLLEEAHRYCEMLFENYFDMTRAIRIEKEQKRSCERELRDLKKEYEIVSENFRLAKEKHMKERDRWAAEQRRVRASEQKREDLQQVEREKQVASIRQIAALERKVAALEEERDRIKKQCVIQAKQWESERVKHGEETEALLTKVRMEDEERLRIMRNELDSISSQYNDLSKGMKDGEISDTAVLLYEALCGLTSFAAHTLLSLTANNVKTYYAKRAAEASQGTASSSFMCRYVQSALQTEEVNAVRWCLNRAMISLTSSNESIDGFHCIEHYEPNTCPKNNPLERFRIVVHCVRGLYRLQSLVRWRTKVLCNSRLGYLLAKESPSINKTATRQEELKFLLPLSHIIPFSVKRRLCPNHVCPEDDAFSTVNELMPSVHIPPLKDIRQVLLQRDEANSFSNLHLNDLKNVKEDSKLYNFNKAQQMHLVANLLEATLLPTPCTVGRVQKYRNEYEQIEPECSNKPLNMSADTLDINDYLLHKYLYEDHASRRPLLKDYSRKKAFAERLKEQAQMLNTQMEPEKRSKGAVWIVLGDEADGTEKYSGCSSNRDVTSTSRNVNVPHNSEKEYSDDSAMVIDQHVVSTVFSTDPSVWNTVLGSGAEDLFAANFPLCYQKLFSHESLRSTPASKTSLTLLPSVLLTLYSLSDSGRKAHRPSSARKDEQMPPIQQHQAVTLNQHIELLENAKKQLDALEIKQKGEISSLVDRLRGMEATLETERARRRHVETLLEEYRSRELHLLEQQWSLSNERRGHQMEARQEQWRQDLVFSTIDSSATGQGDVSLTGSAPDLPSAVGSKHPISHQLVSETSEMNSLETGNFSTYKTNIDNGGTADKIDYSAAIESVKDLSPVSDGFHEDIISRATDVVERLKRVAEGFPGQ